MRVFRRCTTDRAAKVTVSVMGFPSARRTSAGGADLSTGVDIGASTGGSATGLMAPALADLRVDRGVVTLMTTTAGWPDPRDQLWRIRRTSGVTDVVSELTPATVAV